MFYDGFMSNLYKRLEALAPLPEQIAAYKRRRKQRLSNKEKVELQERLAEKRYRRSIAKNPALPILHPERKPSKPIIIKQGAMSGVIRNPADK